MKIAMAQINPTIADIRGNREKIISYIEAAKSRKADMVIFTEMATIGYPPMDLLENRKLVNDNLDSIEEIARHAEGIAVICGYVDLDRETPPMLFNAAAFMRDGKISSRHYKTLLPVYDVFDEIRYFSAARAQSLVEFGGRRVGVTICEDIWNDHDFFEASRAAEDGIEKYDYRARYDTDPIQKVADGKADLVVNISASPFTRGKNRFRRTMLADIARHHSMPVVYVNQVGGNDSLVFDGNSIAFNRKGIVIGHARPFEEDLVLVDTDSDARV